VLDSGPLGLACDRRGKPRVEQITEWRIQAEANGCLIAVPAIADYEVRRELIRAGRTSALMRFDAICGDLPFIPLSVPALRRAAELWADVRGRGGSTAADSALDADAILAAQALSYAGIGDTLIVATDNVRHLRRFVDAQPWELIAP
jgi:predicted nucleic acid-binding protein